MKQKGDWRDKLDDWALELLEGYRKSSAARGTLSDQAKWNQKMEEIAAQHPQIRDVKAVDILPEFLNLLRENEQLADAMTKMQPTPGTKTLPSPAARFVEVMQLVTLALEDPQMRTTAGFAAGFAALIFGNIYDGISTMKFGDAGPKDSKDFMWAVGSTLEFLGKALKSGKAPNIKGKINVELLQIIKQLRQHEKVRLTYAELHDALAYAGVHVQDADALRIFEWRARKKGWIADDDKPATDDK